MAGTDENVATTGDWMPPNPSPRTLISTFLNEDFGSKSFSEFLSKNVCLGPTLEPEKQNLSMAPKIEDSETADVLLNRLLPLESNWFGAQKSNSNGGLAERMAASGFTVPKLNTTLVGATTATSSSLDVLTIPPGLSPTSLLESPVYLSNSTVQPSPTTGKFQFAHYGGAKPTTQLPVSEAPAKVGDELLDDVPEAFAFRPHIDSHSLFFLAAERKQQSGTSVNASLQSGKVLKTGTLETEDLNLQNKDLNVHTGIKDTTDNVMLNQRLLDSLSVRDDSPAPDDQQDGEADHKGELSSVTAGTPSEDGYNWRKYGQKQVKGSEYPRSYYKCTHLNCQVKKKVERSLEGHITEIIYKGSHNHPKPPPTRRSGILSSPLDDQHVDDSEQPGSQASFDGKSTWASTQNANGGKDWRNDGLETSSASLAAAEFCHPLISMQHNQECPRLSSDGADVSSTMSNDEEEDQVTHGSVSLGCDGDGDETESKRRKLEACAIEMSAASRAVREPRVVVQTTSEVDILDDGYRWRKYGQKVVKGNPNPRSYYKCTHPGCTVRKHVERASHDLKSVITTYEGKHNHDVPAARNSGHPSSAPLNASATSVSQQHSVLRRAEPLQDGFMRFDGQQTLGTYGFSGREQLVPSTSFSLAMTRSPGLAGLTMAGMGAMAPIKMPVYPPVHPYLGQQQAGEGRYLIPKGEPKEEQMPDSRLPIQAATTTATAHHPTMGRLPLGPQL